MAQQLADRRDIDFVIWEQMDCEKFLENEQYREFNKKTCELILSEARALAIKEILPTLAEGDDKGVDFDNGTVKVPDSFHRVNKLTREGEWNNLAVPVEMGGQGAPAFIGAAAYEYFLSANFAAFGYAIMGNGTANMIQKYGTDEQRETYVEKLTSAQWGGTMMLTEPDAGSDVGALTTTAVRNDDGTFSLTGNKIFITYGEHDLAENIIHPVLARIEGDPPGTGGISIFIVPKFLVNDDGTLGKRNDVVCTGVEHKHGLKGSATCSMSMGSKGKCIGYLLGEERKGMRIMFNMINESRMGVGFQGLACASAAYLLAVNYARERIQGRDIKDFADASAPSVPIIRHPDVRRNLLWMKSYVDAMRSFYYYLTTCDMKAALSENEEERVCYEDLFSLLTPVLKEYLSVKGHDVCIQGIQVHGGVGYCKDFLAEQYARDCKIASIYEGTSGIQAADLLGRKIGMKNGAVFMNFMGEINRTIAEAKKFEGLEDLAIQLETGAGRLGELTMAMGAKAMSGEISLALAHSLPYLHAMGDVIAAWMLLWRALAASEKLAGKANAKDTAFYEGQIKTAEFFINTELPVTLGKMDAVQKTCGAAIEIDDAGFGGL